VLRVFIMRPATILLASLLTGISLTTMAAVPLATAANADIAIAIDKSTQQMSVTVDGVPRYTWAVSTGRAGYDTPNGSFKPNRMDADHLSQEWDNAPMPHTIFFDLHGHAIHGFFDVKHLGLAVSHGCVRLSPQNAAILFQLVKTEGMANTSVTIAGRTPGGDNAPVAQSRLPQNETVYSAQPGYAASAARPIPLTPQYQGQDQYQDQYQDQDQAPPPPPPQYVQQRPMFPPQPPPSYGQPAYGQRPYGQPYYGQPQPYYGQQQPYYGQPVYRQW
jgi:hypothetical protein